MQPLVTLCPRPGVGAEQFAPHQVAEEREVWRLYTTDVIRSMHWTGRRRGW